MPGRPVFDAVYLSDDPSADMQVASKQYVDNAGTLWRTFPLSSVGDLNSMVATLAATAGLVGSKVAYLDLRNGVGGVTLCPGGQFNLRFTRAVDGTITADQLLSLPTMMAANTIVRFYPGIRGVAAVFPLGTGVNWV